MENLQDAKFASSSAIILDQDLKKGNNGLLADWVAMPNSADILYCTVQYTVLNVLYRYAVVRNTVFYENVPILPFEG